MTTARSFVCITLAVAVLGAAGCQTVQVHPRLLEAGPGLAAYQTVAITCTGDLNTTVLPALTAALKKAGYTVAAGPADLDVRVHVLESKEPNLGGQMIMALFLGGIVSSVSGAGFARFEADADVIDLASGDKLLQFSAARKSRENYDATRSWVDAFMGTWRKYSRRPPARD